VQEGAHGSEDYRAIACLKTLQIMGTKEDEVLRKKRLKMSSGRTTLADKSNLADRRKERTISKSEPEQHEEAEHLCGFYSFRLRFSIFRILPISYLTASLGSPLAT